MRNPRMRAVAPSMTNRRVELLATVCVGVCLIGLITSVQSGPVYERRIRRMLSSSDDIVPVVSAINGKSARNETSPNKDVCLMEGHTIPRRLVSCPTKPGCRAIQKEGECCPEYQCECERDGKLYENGEKIMDPETPCRVCYCQGGEFTCNNVTCYNRNDCKPKYTPGRCCPEYDNCPPLEIPKSDHSDSNAEDEHQHSVLTTANLVSTPSTPVPSSSAPVQPPPSAVGNDNPLGIKIKEITKPEEIRITDEKPKFIVKVSTTSTTTTTTTTTTEVPVSSSSESTSEASYVELSSTSESSSYDQFNKTDDPFQLGEEFDQDLENGTDTNKNVREVHDDSLWNALDVGAEDRDEEVVPEGDKQAEGSEIDDSRTLLFSGSSSTEGSEVVEPMQAEASSEKPEIKHVLIKDNHGEERPFSVKGTEELQFGGGSPDEDLNHYEFHGSPADAPSSSSVNYDVTTESVDITSPETSSSTAYPDYGSSTSTDSSSWSSTTEESSSDAPRIEGEVTVEMVRSSEEHGDEEPVKEEPSSVWPIESSSTAPVVTENTNLENDDLTNPEYPKLPEDLSQHQEEHVGNYNYADTEERSPGEPHLVPEWERTNGTETEEKSSEEEENSVFGFGVPSSPAETEGTSEKSLVEGVSLDGDMMSENSTEERRDSPGPKDQVESLKITQQEEGAHSEDMGVAEETPVVYSRDLLQKRSEIVGRVLSRETNFWDLF